MAPRRSVAKAEDVGASPSTAGDGAAAPSLSDSLTQIGQQVSAALASWPAEGEALKELMLAEAEALLQPESNAPLGSVRLSRAVLSLLESELEVETLSDFLKNTTEEWPEERKDVLWESLVDVVEVLDETKEDCDDLMKVLEGMQVDRSGTATKAETGQKIAQKGMDVIKSLLVRVQSSSLADSASKAAY